VSVNLLARSVHPLILLIHSQSPKRDMQWPRQRGRQASGEGGGDAATDPDCDCFVQRRLAHMTYVTYDSEYRPIHERFIDR
jgi:hypothetical protein